MAGNQQHPPEAQGARSDPPGRGVHTPRPAREWLTRLSHYTDVVPVVGDMWARGAERDGHASRILIRVGQRVPRVPQRS